MTSTQDGLLGMLVGVSVALSIFFLPPLVIHEVIEGLSGEPVDFTAVLLAWLMFTMFFRGKRS